MNSDRPQREIYSTPGGQEFSCGDADVRDLPFCSKPPDIDEA